MMICHLAKHYDDSLGPPKMRLECVASWTLHAPIQSLQKVRLLGSVRDTLVLSFLDAKLSVVEYNIETHNLKTLSLTTACNTPIKQQVPLSGSLSQNRATIL